MNLRAVITIAHKDLLDAIRNLYILFGLTLPLGMALLFRLMFPDSGVADTMTVVVWDPSGSLLVTQLRALPQVRIVEAATAEQVPEEVEQKAVGGLLVPVGFDTAVRTGEKPDLAVYVNRRHGGGEINAFQRLIEQQVWSLVGQDTPANIVYKQVAALPGIQDQVDFNFERFLLVMLLIMALAMAGSFMVPTLLVEEKEKHTLEVLLLAPAGPAEVAAGKAITGLVYSLLGAVILLAFYQGWTGSWILTLVALLLGALFTVGVGLLMGALFRNINQVNTWSSLVMLLLLVPSWTGILGPETAIDVAVRLVPTHYLARALQLSLAGEIALPAMAGDLAMLAASVLVIYAGVMWLIARERK